MVSSPSHVEPLLVNGQVLASSTSTTTVDTALQATTVTPEYSNLISLALFLVSISTLLGGSVFILVKYFHEIWQSGFVAALLLGGIAFAVQAATVWFLKNVVVRRFYTTMQLSRENKESTPVLEWFKVWLPRYMKQRKLILTNILVIWHILEILVSWSGFAPAHLLVILCTDFVIIGCNVLLRYVINCCNNVSIIIDLIANLDMFFC